MPRRNAALAAGFLALACLAPMAPGTAALASESPDPTASAPTPSTSYKAVPSKFSLTVSPTRLVIRPTDLGRTHKMLVVNRGEEPVAVNVQKRNFTGASDGTLVFQRTARYSASSWVTLSPTKFVLAPGQSRTVTAKVVLGQTPEPGDHQVALVFLVPALRTSANVKINRGIATPVYVTVPGSSDDSVRLSGLDAPGFSTGGSVAISAKVRNTGTVHRDFRGSSRLAIRAAGDPTKFPDFTVVRDSDRDIRASWDPPMMCICHPTVKIVNPDGGTQTTAIRVIVFPLHLVGIGVAALVAILVLLAWRRRRYRADVDAAAARLRDAAGRENA